MTTQQASYGLGEKKGPCSHPMVRMDAPATPPAYHVFISTSCFNCRTYSIIHLHGIALQTGDGQILSAMGRSGARQERGLQGSGLTGEVLNTSHEPSKNSFVQRMWMYQDDSALYHRQNGVPEATNCEGLSFPIGEHEYQQQTNVKKANGRASTDLMFSSIKKTGYKIFQDDEHGETANLEYHYKC